MSIKLINVLFFLKIKIKIYINYLNDYFLVNQLINFNKMAQSNPPELSVYHSFQKHLPQMEQPPSYETLPQSFAAVPATIVVGTLALGQDSVQVM